VNSKTFAIGYTVTTVCNTYTNNTALAVPDGVGANTPGAVVTNTITVPVTGTISDVNVGLNVTHTYPQDLIIALNHPDATQDVLWGRACAGNDNFNVTLNDGAAAFTCVANMSGTFAPSSPLAVFNSKPSNGVWTLLAADYYNDDSGSINSWSLQVCTQQATLATHDVGFDNFAVYPNPSNGNFNIQFNTSSSNGIKVLVHDMRGRSIFENEFSSSATFNQNIHLNNAQAGVYLLTVTDGDRKEVKKIVVE
jgi:subtilisin-like proprotein convertase family protein